MGGPSGTIVSRSPDVIRAGTFVFLVYRRLPSRRRDLKISGHGISGPNALFKEGRKPAAGENFGGFEPQTMTETVFLRLLE